MEVNLFLVPVQSSIVLSVEFRHVLIIMLFCCGGYASNHSIIIIGQPSRSVSVVGAENVLHSYNTTQYIRIYIALSQHLQQSALQNS